MKERMARLTQNSFSKTTLKLQEGDQKLTTHELQKKSPKSTDLCR